MKLLKTSIEAAAAILWIVGVIVYAFGSLAERRSPDRPRNGNAPAPSRPASRRVDALFWFIAASVLTIAAMLCYLFLPD
jgi:hypothetical protein